MDSIRELIGSFVPFSEVPAAGSVEELLGIISLKKGVLHHRGGYCLAMEIEPLNFLLKSEEEQAFIISTYNDLLKLMKRPYQIITLSLPADISEHIEYVARRASVENLEEIHLATLSYLRFASEVSRQQAVTRRYFLILPAVNLFGGFEEAYRDLAEVRLRAQQVFRRCGNDISEKEPNKIWLEILCFLLKREYATNSDLSELVSLREIMPSYIDDTDPQAIKIEGSFSNYLLCVDYPYSVPAAWLTGIINAGEGIELSLTAFPLPKRDTVHEITCYTGYSQGKLIEAPNAVDSDITASALQHALYIRKALSEGDELWDMCLIIKVSASDREVLRQKTRDVESLLTMQGIRYAPASYRQKEAFLSTLPLVTMIPSLRRETKRNILASSLCSTYPFVSYEVSDPSGVMLGINEHNGSPVLLDIFNSRKYSNANMVVLGSSGSGKTFATQLLASRFRLQGVQTMFICPLKGHEYRNLCNNLGGKYIRLAPGSGHCINIMEIRGESLRNHQDSFLSVKMQSLRAFFSIMLPDLTFRQRQKLDEVLMLTYQEKGITLDNSTVYDYALVNGYIPLCPKLKEMPTLGDLHSIITSKSEDPDYADIASKLTPYVTGSLRVFNGQTNVELDNRYVVCDVSDMTGDQAVCLAMYLILDIYKDRIQKDPTEKKCLIIDEVWRLIGAGGNALTADYVMEMYKSIRGYGGAVISATQDINDLFALEEGRYGRAMLNSAKIKLILPMEEHETRVLKEILGLSSAETGYITHAERGHGLLYAGSSRITLDILASPEEHRLITTDRNELELLKRGGRLL